MSGGFSSRAGKDEHQQIQAYVNLASPGNSLEIQWLGEKKKLFQFSKSNGWTFSKMFWEDFYWSSFGHVLLSEPITMARGIALIGQAQVMGTSLGSGGSLLVHSTESGEG